MSKTECVTSRKPEALNLLKKQKLTSDISGNSLTYFTSDYET